MEDENRAGSRLLGGARRSPGAGRGDGAAQTKKRREKKKKKISASSLFFSFSDGSRGGSDEGKGRLNEEEAEPLATSQLDNKGLM